jgi:DNA-binding transcriptional LysR family regulator
VTAAARELNYAQPSISHHLARLEAETGTKLIQRAGRGVRLTEAGRLLADRAAEVLGRLDAAENELAAHAGLRRGRVRLAAFSSALGTIVPLAAARLRAGHPGLEIMLTEAEPPEALRMLRAGSVDVALVFRHQAGSVDGGAASRARLLLDEQVFLVTPVRSHPAPAAGPAAGPTAGPTAGPAARYEPDRDPMPPEPAAGGAATGGPAAGAPAGADLAAYAGERWIAGCERSRGQLLDLCARAGFTPSVAFTTDDTVAAQALVAAGLGVTVLPGLALRAARHQGIQASPLAAAHRYVFAVTYGAPPDPPPTARLIDALVAAASTAYGAPRAGEPATGEPASDPGAAVPAVGAATPAAPAVEVSGASVAPATIHPGMPALPGA